MKQTSNAKTGMSDLLQPLRSGKRTIPAPANTCKIMWGGWSTTTRLPLSSCAFHLSQILHIHQTSSGDSTHLVLLNPTCSHNWKLCLDTFQLEVQPSKAAACECYYTRHLNVSGTDNPSSNNILQRKADQQCISLRFLCPIFRPPRFQSVTAPSRQDRAVTEK